MDNQLTPKNRLMSGVIPYLALDNVDDAIAFYQKAFGGIVRGEPARDDSGNILNASLEINSGCLMLSDHQPMMGDKFPKSNNALTMQIVTDKGRFWWDRAVAAGCVVDDPFEVKFWGDEYGRLEDPFGVKWAILQPSEQALEAAKQLEIQQ